MRFGGALLAGVVYGFNLWLVTWLSYPHSSVWALIPWMLLATERLIRRPDLLSGAGLAAVTGIAILAGHPESTFHAVLTTVAFFLLRIVQLSRRREAGGRPVLCTGAFVGALAGGAALAALMLLPFGELLFHSADLAQRRGAAIDKHVQTRWLIELFLPDYYGRPTQTPIELFLLARAFYAGALPLMLAAVALIVRPKAERVWIALFGALWLAVLFGLPPFLQIVTRLPVFSSGHNSRLIILWMLSLALLAGWGLDDLTSRRRSLSAAKQKAVLGVGAALLLAPAAWIVLGHKLATGYHPLHALAVAWDLRREPGPLFSDPTAADVIRLASLLGWLTFAALGLGLIAAALRTRVPNRFLVSAAVVILALDLFRIGMGYNPAIDKRYASPPTTPAIRYLQRQRPARFVSMDPAPQNVIGMRWHIDEARGYDLPVVKRYDHLWRREVSPNLLSQTQGFLAGIPLTMDEVTQPGLRTLRLLGVRSIYQPSRTALLNVRIPPVHARGLRMVYDGPDGRVYRVAGTLPRTWVVGRQQVVSGGEAAFKAVTRPGFSARSTAVTEERIPGLSSAPAGRGVSSGTARIASYAPEHVAVDADAPHGGLLVLDDTYFPGWRATVDGHPVKLSQVDYVLRGVPLPPGRHRVDFRYAPVSWRVGWIVSVLAVLGLIAAIVVGARRRRRRPTGTTRPARREEPLVAARP
jgi:Bacterial membrane protein YfhO